MLKWKEFDNFFYVNKFKIIENNNKICNKCADVNRNKISNYISDDKVICFCCIWSDISYDLNKQIQYNMLFTSLKLIDKTLKSSLIYQSIEINHILLTKILHIKKNIMNKINEVYYNYNNYIGFHIRTGSGDFKDKKRMKIDTEIEMIKLGYSYNKKSNLFIASDFELVKQIFKEYYGKRVYIYSQKTYHSDIMKNDDISLIELILLSKSDYLIITPGSTYSLIALYMNNNFEKYCNYDNNISKIVTFFPNPNNLIYYEKICEFC